MARVPLKFLVNMVNTYMSVFVVVQSVLSSVYIAHKYSRWYSCFQALKATTPSNTHSLPPIKESHVL